MARMKLSVLDLVPVFGDYDDAYALERAAELAQTSERLGYTRYWVAEHHDMKRLACPSPEVLLAHIGARTERIRIGAGAVLLPHYAPLKVAESYHLLASLYPGRIDLGIGRAPGASTFASIALSGNFLENVRRMPDKVKDLAQLLQGSYAYEGNPVAARPRPAVPPEPWMLGTNKKSAEYAAQYGMGYVFGQFMSDARGEDVLRSYREAFVPSPLCPEPKAILTVGVVCAESEEEAKDLARQNTWLFRDETPGSEGQTPPYSERRLIVGAPPQVRDLLEQIAVSCGVDEIMVVTLIPDYAKRLKSYELLARLL